MRIVAEGVETGAAGAAVGEIAEGRNQEGDLRSRRAFLRPDEERYVVLSGAGPQARGVDAALQVRRHLEFEAGFPLRILEVVVVKVDRTVLLRGALEVHLQAGPVVPGHRPRREIDRRA